MEWITITSALSSFVFLGRDVTTHLSGITGGLKVVPSYWANCGMKLQKSSSNEILKPGNIKTTAYLSIIIAVKCLMPELDLDRYQSSPQAYVFLICRLSM